MAKEDSGQDKLEYALENQNEAMVEQTKKEHRKEDCLNEEAYDETVGNQRRKVKRKSEIKLRANNKRLQNLLV